MAARAAYMLEPAANTREHAARAIIEDGYATEAMAKAEKRIHGKTTLYRDLRNRVTALHQEVETVFGSAPDGPPHEWQIEGQGFIGPSEAVRRFGDIQQQGRVHEGIYDRLSTHTHPSLGALLFFDRHDDGRPLEWRSTDRYLVVCSSEAHGAEPTDHRVRHQPSASTISVPTIPASACPGTVQRKPNSPGVGTVRPPVASCPGWALRWNPSSGMDRSWKTTPSLVSLMFIGAPVATTIRSGSNLNWVARISTVSAPAMGGGVGSR